MSDHYRFKLLVGQRKQRHEGEHAPEALAVISEFGNDDNPAYMQDMLAENRADPEFEAVEIIDVLIPWKELDARLFPSRIPLEGKIV